MEIKARPFCRHLLERNLTYTRERINQMSNGQIPNVFLSAGGWRCRCQWVLALDQVTRVREGVHYGTVHSDLSDVQTGRVLSALDGSPALGILSEHKIESIAITCDLPKDWKGLYDYRAGGTVQVNSIRRRGYHYGELFVPGASSQISVATDDKFESMRRVLLHETAHHRQSVGGDAVSRILDRAWGDSAKRSITKYASKLSGEYLAETWVAFHTHWSQLRSYDPVGCKMIEDVLRALAGL